MHSRDDRPANSHGLMATQANLTSNSLCHANIHKCCSNAASDDDFLPPGMKIAVWDREQSPNFAYIRGGGLQFIRLNRNMHVV